MAQPLKHPQSESGDWSLETGSSDCVTIMNVVAVRQTILAFIGRVCPMLGRWGAPAWRVSWSSSSVAVSMAVSTRWHHLSDRVHTFTLCWDQSYEAEGRVQLCGAMSALVDLPGVANPQKDDWCLVEGYVSGRSCDGSAPARCPNRWSRLFVVTDVWLTG